MFGTVNRVSGLNQRCFGQIVSNFLYQKYQQARSIFTTGLLI